MRILATRSALSLSFFVIATALLLAPRVAGQIGYGAPPRPQARADTARTQVPVKPAPSQGPFGADSLPPPGYPSPGVQGSTLDSVLAFPNVTPPAPGSKTTADDVGPPPPSPPPEEAHLVGPAAAITAAEADAQGRGQFTLWRWVEDGSSRSRRTRLSGGELGGFGGGQVPSKFQLKVGNSRVVREIDVDLERGNILRSTRLDNLTVDEAPPQHLRDFAHERIFAGRWRDYTRESRALLGRQVTPGGEFLGEGRRGFTLAAPGGMLGPAEAVLGPGASITIRGTERISISGTSNWDAHLRETERRRQSKFPQLDLRQDLNINVDGKVGDKVSIDWTENSNQETPLANRIAIRYNGYEEEVVKAVELGNTNLSLPGTQFVSYNGQHQGLFGIKTQSQFGSLGLTVIASKQEGQTASNRFVGYAQETQRQIYDLDYVQRRFFFLVDPVDPLLRGTFLPPEDPDWVLPPRISNLQLWRDDRIQTNNGRAIPGFAFVGHRFTSPGAPDTAVTAHFDLLLDQEDYAVQRNFFTIRDAQNVEHNYAVIDVKSPIGQDDILAATFTATYRINGRDVIVTYGEARPDTVLAKALFVPQGFTDLRDGEFVSRNQIWYPVRRLELRNIYSLGATDIDLATLKLSVKRFGEDDPLHFPGADPDATFLRGLGADKRVNQNSTEGFDEQIDRELLKPDLGLVILPDLRPFAPAAEDSVWPFFRADLPAGRPAFFVNPHDNRAVYDHPSPDRGVHRKYFFEVSFATPQTQFVLSAPGTILEGSETVVVDGQPLARGSGYTIDYETGIVSLTGTTPLPQNAQIAIDYAYAPLFALGQKTLMGFHAGWDPGAGTGTAIGGRRFGTTWLFESSGVSERRPKLGEEPARTVVGDLNGGFQSKPFFMNQLVEALPGVRASADSRFELTAEVGLSLPNPNTRGEVYIEDFEGAKENSILSLQREDWFWSSIPDTILEESSENRRGQLIWYNPVISPVFERDLFPELLQREEGNDRRSILTLNVDPQRADSAGFDPKTWVGLTQAISGSGADFTRKQYIEVWVNDFGDGTFLAAHPRMILDLGTIDEDAQWHPTERPNSRHDTEDNKSVDGILDRSVGLFEDTGLDSLQSVDEPGYSSANPDPHGDDFPLFDREEAEQHPQEPKLHFAGINRFEENQHLEDEDLNHDKFLNRNNSYFEYSIDLGDSLYVAADVCQEFGRCGPQERDPRGRPTRWRLYRIPIEAGRQVNSPSLGSVRHFRIWFTGFPEERLIQIAGIDILGNLFKVEPLRNPKGIAIPSAPGEVVSIRGINNKENAEYIPPFPLQEQNRIVEREQSLAIDFQSLGSGHEGSAFRALPSDRDFTLYETIKWWIYGKGETEGVEAFVRFGADTLNYYEYAVPVRAGWSEEEVPLTELSGLKLEATAGDSCEVGGTRLPCFSRRRDDGRLLRSVGRPSFTRLRRVTFGVRNAGTGAPSGSVWFDDLRLDEVFRDRGQATRVEIETAFADLLTLSTDLLTRDEDFLSIGSGGQRVVNRGLGSRQRDLGLRSTMQLHKFFETSGIKLPVAFNYSRNRELPEFRAGDDIVLTGANSRIQERGSVQRSYSANWSRTGAQAGLLKYTLDSFAANFSLNDQRSLSQTRRDSSRTINLGLSYRLAPALKPILFGKTELRYFPDQISLSLQGISGRTFSYNRDLENPARRELVSAVYQKNAALNGTTGISILRSLRAGYNINSNRDLTADNPAGWLGGLNIGSEVSRNQGLDFTWNPNPAILRQVTPNMSFHGASHDDHSRNLRVAGDREQVRNLGATQTLNGTFNVPITLLTGQGPSSPAPGDSTRPLRRFQNQLGRVGRLRDVRVNLSANNSRDFGYATGVPRWLYQLGLSTHPGADIELTGRGVENRGTSRNATLGSGFDLKFGVTIGTTYSWRTTRNEVTSNTPRASRTVTWPQLDLDWRTVHTRIPTLGKAFKTVNLESRYTRDLSESGPVGNASQNVTERRDWNPLVGMNGTLVGGWNLRARVNSTGSEDRANEANLGGFTNSTRRQFQVDLSRRFDAQSGLKFPWQKEPIKLKSDLSLNTNVSYSTDRSESGRRGQAAVVSRDGSTMSIRSGVSYNFRRNIDGELSINFGRNNDKKQDRALRTISLSGSLVFNF